MTFLVLILALAIDKLTSWRERLQRDGWWLVWLRQVERSPFLGGRAWMILLVIVIGPMILLAVTLQTLYPLAHGWLALPVHLWVLLYSFGRGDIHRTLGPFRDVWRREDIQGAYHVAERDMNIQGRNASEVLGAVQSYVLWQGYQGFFAVMFWYVLFGPVGALAYRLLALTIEHTTLEPLRAQASAVRHALDWLPVRCLMLSFALVGNFSAVMKSFLHDLLAWSIPGMILLIRTGRAATDADIAPGREGVESLDSLWHLLVRCAVLWYSGCALLVLFGQ